MGVRWSSEMLSWSSAPWSLIEVDSFFGWYGFLWNGTCVLSPFSCSSHGWGLRTFTLSEISWSPVDADRLLSSGGNLPWICTFSPPVSFWQFCIWCVFSSTFWTPMISSLKLKSFVGAKFLAPITLLFCIYSEIQWLFGIPAYMEGLFLSRIPCLALTSRRVLYNRCVTGW